MPATPRWVLVILEFALGAVFGAIALAFAVYQVTWWHHWNTYHSPVEFWGNVLAVVWGAPTGGVLGAFAGSLVAVIASGRRRERD